MIGRVILGLDLGRTLGWAVYDVDRQWVHMESYTLLEDEKKPAPGALYADLEGHLEMLMMLKDVPSPTEVWVEMPHHRGGATTRLLNGYLAVAGLVAYVHHLPLHTVHSATLKKLATGSGRAGKEAMRDATLKHKTGVFISELDDNAIDAFWVAVYGGMQEVSR